MSAPTSRLPPISIVAGRSVFSLRVRKKEIRSYRAGHQSRVADARGLAGPSPRMPAGAADVRVRRRLGARDVTRTVEVVLPRAAPPLQAGVVARSRTDGGIGVPHVIPPVGRDRRVHP